MIKQFKKFMRYAVYTITLLVLALTVVFPKDGAKKAYSEGANTPRFNFLEGDREMLQVAKTTDSDWNDPITANVGDRVAFLLYYHNGMINTTAHSTKVRIDLPIDESNQIVAKSWLWSQETAAISDTVVNGQVVGLSGATINLPSKGRIEYVPGSTNWFPNGSKTATHMPDGIISDSGLDLGDIQGCWGFAGFVTILADIKGPAQLVMDKTVAHLGESEWHKEIDANPGDTVAYHLGIRNNGGTIAKQVSVNDSIPTYMSYVPGTTFLFTKDHPEGIKQADTLFSSSLVLPDIAIGQENVVYLTYKTKITTDMPAGAFALNNVARVFMAGIEQDQDQAKVIVTGIRGLVLKKQVSNGVSWVDESTAKLGDRIDYRITVRNTGNIPITDVILKDALPVFVEYITGSTKVDDITVSDQIISESGLNIGTLNPGQERFVKLSGIVKGCPPIGGFDLINTVFGKATGVSEISASAKTIVNVLAPEAPKV